MAAFRPIARVPGLSVVEKANPRNPGEAAVGMDDAVLLAEIRAGNPVVSDAFCRRVWPQVDRTVRRLLGPDDSEGEDLSQVAVIELVKTIGSYRGDCALDTWVSAVTAHVVYKQLRGRSANRHVSLDLIPDDSLPSSRTNSEGTLATREVLDRILGHLEKIGEKLAWSFLLHDVLGHGLRDVARILRVSEAAAQSRLVRGRRVLHQRIAEDPELAELFNNLERLQKP